VKKYFKESASWNYAEVWNKFPIPARPCSKELSIIKNELKKRKSSKVLILGSTIEYRSLCKKLGIKPVVVDFKKENYNILSKYSKEKFLDETFIESDWLKINYFDEFDFILGHRIFNVIEKKSIQKMFQKMFIALKKDGIYFCRGNIFNKQSIDIIEQIIKEKSFTKRKYPLFTYIEVALYMKCCDKNNYVNYSKCRKLIKKWFNEKKISKKEFNHIMLLISMSDEARFRTPEKEEIIKSYKKNGFIGEWITTGDQFSENMPIIKLSKK
jgi:ubiquinone/menaquinone biosynthesis C-methylase UbiE